MGVKEHAIIEIQTQVLGLIWVSLKCIIVLFGVLDNVVLNPMKIQHCVFFSFSRSPFLLKYLFILFIVSSALLISPFKLSIESECMN